MEYVLVMSAVLIYLLPWIIAASRSHPQVAPIFIINLFLGWTLIGWVLTLAWSATAIKKAT